MKLSCFRVISALTLGLVLTLTLLGLMTYLSPKTVLAAGPHHVAPDCTGVPAPCYTSIQAAVDAADPGDVIMVAAGTYTGVNSRLSGNFYASGWVTQTLYLSKNVTIHGGYTTSFTEPPDPQANPAILDAQGQGRGIYSVGVSPTIEGLTIVNGDASAPEDLARGILYVFGGGIYALDGNPIISGNNIVNNVAYYGGGVAVFSARPKLSHNLIATNTALSQGGGLWVASATITIDYNQIRSNTAPSGGGFYGETADFKNNTFVGNTADYGGALYTQNDCNLTNNIIASNQATIVGSGAYLFGDSQLFHNTFADNRGGDGTGIYVANHFGYPGSTILTNTILVSQTVGLSVSAGSTATLNSTLWNGNTTDWGGAGTITAANNYTGDPAFVNPSAGDYHLGPTSAAIDKGITTEVAADIDSDARPQGAAPDLGADEYFYAPILSIAKSGPASGTPGSPITYTLTVTNSGNLTAANLVITDAIPAGANYLSGGTQANGVVSWTVLALPPGLSTTVQFAVTATDSLVNRVYGVTADGGYSAAGASPVVTLLPQGCEAYPLALPEIKVAGLQPGDTIGPLNNGWFGWVSWNSWNIGSPNSEMTLLKELQNPALSLTDFTDEINFTDYSLSIGDWVHHNNGTINSNQTYAELDHLMANGITMRVVVGDQFGGGINSFYHISDFILVEITGFTWNPYPLQTLTLTYLGPAEDPETCRQLGVELTPAQPQSGLPGQVLTYTHHLTNLSHTPETALLIYTTSLTGWPVTVTPTSQTLQPGQTVTVTALVTIPLDSPDSLTQLTTLTAALAVSPAVSAAVADTTSVVNRPELSLSKSGPVAVTPGSPITYTLTVTNSGNLTATYLVITDAIPAGATYINGGAKSGDGVIWAISSLPAKDTAQVTFVVTTTQSITNSNYRVSAEGGYSATGSISVTTVMTDTPISGLSAVNDSPTTLGGLTTLTATIATGDNVAYKWSLGDGAVGGKAMISHTYPAVGRYTAIVTASNSVSFLTATTRVTITGGPNLTISKSGPVAVTPGSPITYTLTVTNSGNLTATNLVITDAIPAGATYVGGGTLVGGVVSWTVPGLASGGGVAQASFIVTATQTITNSDYGVRADRGYSTRGNTVIVTVMGETIVEQSIFLPVILKR